MELNMPGCLTWERDIYACDACEDAISGTTGGITVQGRLETVEEDGTAVVRVGGAVLLLDTEGTAVPGVLRVRVTAAIVELYDTVV